MSLETLLFSALSTVPEVARTGPMGFAVYPVIFPQPMRFNPQWPAIRYSFVSSVPPHDICGDGEDDTTVTRVQIDIVALTRPEVRAIRLEVKNIMAALDPPASLDLEFDEFDGDTQTFRWVMDYIITPSSTSGSPTFP